MKIHDFFEVLETQVSSQFCLVHECNPWYLTQSYGVTQSHSDYKLQNFLYKFKKKSHLNT